MSKTVVKRSVIAFCVSLIILILDQFTKWYATVNIENFYGKDIIKGILEFAYLHNDGVAYGLLSGKRWFFVVFSGIALLAMFVGLFYKKVNENSLLLFSLACVLGGGMGNFIDRLRYGYVVDFMRFPLKWFYYSFNVADVAVVCGGIAIVVILIYDIIKDQKKTSASEKCKDESDDEHSKI